METVKRGSRGAAALMAQILLNDRIRELPEQNGRPNQILKEARPENLWVPPVS